MRKPSDRSYELNKKSVGSSCAFGKRVHLKCFSPSCLLKCGSHLQISMGLTDGRPTFWVQSTNIARMCVKRYLLSRGLYCFLISQKHPQSHATIWEAQQWNVDVTTRPSVTAQWWRPFPGTPKWAAHSGQGNDKTGWVWEVTQSGQVERRVGGVSWRQRVQGKSSKKNKSTLRRQQKILKVGWESA